MGQRFEVEDDCDLTRALSLMEDDSHYVLGGGTYSATTTNGEAIRVKNAGVVIEGAPGAEVILDAGGRRRGVVGQGCDRLTLANMTLANATPGAVLIAGASDVTLRELRCYGPGGGIALHGVRRGHVERCLLVNAGITFGGGGDRRHGCSDCTLFRVLVFNPGGRAGVTFADGSGDRALGLENWVVDSMVFNRHEVCEFKDGAKMPNVSRRDLDTRSQTAAYLVTFLGTGEGDLDLVQKWVPGVRDVLEPDPEADDFRVAIPGIGWPNLADEAGEPAGELSQPVSQYVAGHDLALVSVARNALSNLHGENPAVDSAALRYVIAILEGWEAKMAGDE